MNGLDPEEWYCSVNIGIEEIRFMYSHLEYSLKMWPGSPARPVEEQQFLMDMKDKYFAMLMEYNFSEK